MSEAKLKKDDEKILMEACINDPELLVKFCRIIVADNELTRSLRHSLNELQAYAD